MALNRDRTDPETWTALDNWALRQVMFIINLHRLQRRAGRHILHEHPQLRIKSAPPGDGQRHGRVRAAHVFRSHVQV